MIALSNVHKAYATASGPSVVLDGVDMVLGRGESIGILGRNGAGKSTMIRIISGAEQPDSGTVERTMSVSWPLAFGGAFQGSLTGLDNLRFICRVYGVDLEERLQFVEDFAELGIYLREPVRTYSAGMRARLAFAGSMVVDFDCFLIDEIVAVGDARFQAKCHEELFVKRADRAMIIVSHDPGYIRAHCQRAAVLHQGQLLHFPSVDEAFAFYTEQQS
ncbi:sugar ABC transporter ATP-binding protein [Polymorphobacter multimanifer]|uniref:Capsular polysaccharide transport system ATP-binding protein n=1 Tax=Polymorphobacter multimanifer TaxID=1070431 RepID=A0A841L6E8_9SPHN|nr:ABC transporter ATP-binding protein [Polymorphobacter multimanifer]MBB6227806.1 capsular polysaccharide transport system ATP-binding protein [Polymorphobacter multimanifer]GGI78777.1 sugar ABC transporter ATP-binding protein [Polymorphobacter multimanifer]